MDNTSESPRRKFAIIDLTDCEGCQLVLVALKEKLLSLTEKIEILEWRLTQEHNISSPASDGPTAIDVAIIEGTPLTAEEIEIVKEVRQRSKIVAALGACAAIGGVNAMLTEAEREELKAKIYQSEYALRAIDSQPLSAHIKVDVVIPGCPVDQDEAEGVLAKLAHGLLPQPKPCTVCMECKAAQNRCLLLDNQPCLGPATRGGCGALCISHGIPCYGCWGALDGSNLDALKNKWREFMSEEEINARLRIFWKGSN